MISTCQCDHCGAAVEFELDQWQEGAVGDCQHCNQETRLKRVDLFETPKEIAKNRSEALARLPTEPRKWRAVGVGSEVVFFVLGFLLVGLSATLFLTSANAINEVFCSIIAACGLFCWGVMAILNHLRNLAEKP